MYRKNCFAANFKTLFGINAELLTSLMALGAGKRQGDFPVYSTPSRATSVWQRFSMCYDTMHLLL